MQDNDIIRCQHCGENVFIENTQKTKKGRICDFCLEPVIFHSVQVEEEE